MVRSDQLGGAYQISSVEALAGQGTDARGNHKSIPIEDSRARFPINNFVLNMQYYLFDKD